MAADDIQKEINPNEMLLGVTENLFSDKIEIVKNLLQSSRELFSQEVLDQSLLSCCRKHRLLLLPAIISAGANLEVTDENGNTPLLVCALYNNESCARCLIGAGANVNASNFHGDTPLIVSVLKSAFIAMTKLLVGSQDIKIDHLNSKDYTALLYAIETANFNAIKLLIDASDISGINEVFYENVLKDMANKNIILSLINLFKLQKATGESPFLHAALDRDLESAQIMISMDKSIVNASKDSLASVMIQFLESIEENNNVVNQTEVEIFEILLTQTIGKFISSKEKEMIMDTVVSIGNCELLDQLLKFDFIISYENLSSAVSNPKFLCFLLTKRHVINKFNCNNKPVYHDSPLHKAMKGVELESAKSLIQHGAFMDIDQALEDAVKWNKEKALQFIISEFPNQVDQKLKSPKMLREAVINSSINIIPVLLDNGADINTKCNNKYCLTQAVDVNVLELLLSRGADPNVNVGFGHYTYPIHTFLSTEFKNTLLEKWRDLGNHDMSNISLISEIKDFIECLLRHEAQVDLKDDQGRTALHIAAIKYDSTPIVKLLIDSGADVNQKDNDGETPLGKAVKNDDVEMVQCLINSGADINFVYKSTGKPVIFEVNDSAILKILLDNGAEVKSIDGESLLNSLLVNSHIETENVKRLIDAGCDVNHVHKDGHTVLILAAHYVDISLLELLVQEGADVNASGRKFPYKTAVTAMFIKLWNYPEEAISCIKYLLDQNANIDKVHPGVIHAFMTSGCLSLIPRFISCGLAPTHLSVKDSRDPWFTFNTCFSPLLMALVLNQSELVKYFININYLVKSDIEVLYGKWDLQIPIDEITVAKGLSLLSTFVQGPLSLETLCLIVISDTLGDTQDRRSKVRNLKIPQTLQKELLFKNATRSDIKDVDTRNLYYFKHSLELLNLHRIDPDYDNSSDYFESGEEI